MDAIQHNVPLDRHTTLGLGGAASHFVRVGTDASLREAVDWAETQGLPISVLGGGSNLVIGDEGVRGLVLQPALRGLELAVEGRPGHVRVGAGEPWDAVVAAATHAGLSGIECLSGIPGFAGATPIQNVGAYGQEIADVLQSVRVFDRTTGRLSDLSPADCALTYRNSALRRTPDRYIVLAIELALAAGGTPELRYAELRRSLERVGATTPARVRDEVLKLRRAKSMVIDPSDDNRRSAGSFFTNPIVPNAVAANVRATAEARGLLGGRDMPSWPVDEGTTKLAAGWLVEAAGFVKGERRGPVGISSAHALALVHHGGGTTAQLLDLAREIRDRVADRFGVRLVPEPVMLGVEF